MIFNKDRSAGKRPSAPKRGGRHEKRKKKDSRRDAGYVKDPTGGRTDDEDPVMIDEDYDADPFSCHLPALVLEMRKEHEQVVEAKGWIPFALMPFIPAAGSIALFIAALWPDMLSSKNIRNYVLPAAVVSAAYTVLLIIGFVLAMKHGHQIRMFILGLRGG